MTVVLIASKTNGEAKINGKKYSRFLWVAGEGSKVEGKKENISVKNRKHFMTGLMDERNRHKEERRIGIREIA